MSYDPVEWNHDPSFYQWLHTRLKAHSAVGEVARWIYADKKHDGRSCWPARSNTITHLVLHLRTRHMDAGSPTEIALRKAFDAYRAFIAEGGKIPVRRGGIVPPKLPKDLTRQHRGYLIRKATIKLIKDLARHHELTQGEVIERLVEREAASVL